MDPRHIAIIMDGNGRWARQRNHSRFFGHVRGAKVAKSIIEESAKRGISNLTLFAFSSENWLRPEEEVGFLMRLLARHLKRERAQLMTNNIRFRVIGERTKLSREVQRAIEATEEATADNAGMQLTFAISYGGRQEITDAARRLAQKSISEGLDPSHIDEAMLNAELSSSYLPDPDLVIRTSGECRISNFMIWQMAYSELYFTEKMWPEFDSKEFDAALRWFKGKERRYGRTTDQLKHVDLTAEAPVH